VPQARRQIKRLRNICNLLSSLAPLAQLVGAPNRSLASASRDSPGLCMTVCHLRVVKTLDGDRARCLECGEVIEGLGKLGDRYRD
jgi:hypothetical protein